MATLPAAPRKRRETIREEELRELVPVRGFEPRLPRIRYRGGAVALEVSRVDGERQYLAFAPTGTVTPDFHVPQKFVELVFTGGGPGINSSVG